MLKIRTTLMAVLASAMAVIALPACSADDGGSLKPGNRPGSGDDGAGGNGDDPDGGTGGSAGWEDPDGVVDGGDGDKCSETSEKAERMPLDMYIMLDKSGSMAWNNNGDIISGGASNPNSRWYQVTHALKAFVDDPASAGMGVGLGYFPGSPECNANTYRTPAVGIGLLPPHAGAIQSSLTNTSPVGGTPTRYALEGALQHAKEWSDNHPDHTVIVVLATDGEPSGCSNGNSMSNIRSVASEYANQGIKTFVIGIGNQTGNLNEIAAAGGTGQAIMVIGSNAQQQFIDAMNDIRGVALACEYAIPPPKEGEQLDYEKVNLRFTAGDGTKTDIVYLKDSSQCGSGGWYYDDPSAPTKILVCPETCDTFKADDQGEVNVVLGCKRREPI